MHRAPLLLPALAFLSGIVAEAHGCATLAGGLALALAFVSPGTGGALACGVLAGALHGHPFVVQAEARTARYAGVVIGDVRAGDDATTFPFAVSGFGTLRAVAHVPVRAGERLIVRGRIAPFDEPRNPGEPSARAIGIDEGLSGELAVQHVFARAPPDGHDVRVWPALLRERASRTIRALIPEPEATILAGALWGERGTLSPGVRDDFQATGTVHVLVTAGLHLGVIAALAGTLLAWCGVPRVPAALATIPLVYAYAVFSGWHLPAQRAAAMISVALLARAAGARTFSLNTLAIAAIIVGACWPVAVESVSFALSFSCVTAIVLFAGPIGAWLRSMRVPEPIADALALTCATQIGVWPLTAATFFTLAPYATLANALVVPVIGAVLTLGVALLAVQPLAPLAAVVGRWETWLIAVVMSVTHGVAALPGARITIAPPPWWTIAAYDAAAVVAAVVLRRSGAAAILIVLIASGAVVGIPLVPADGTLHLTMLDVGQGDGIVVRTPHGRTILIDAGGRLERGATIDGVSPAERSAERIVLPYLRRAGISRVDLLVLTHPHGDHVGGAAPIINAMPVDMIFDSGQPYAGRAYNDALSAARSHGVPIVLARRGMQWTSGDGVSLDILAPSVPFLADTGDDVNENSIVVMLRYHGFRGLFMGDAGEASERRLLASGDDLRADVVKVGHHGSRYASTPAFVAAVHPRLAIISVGRHNTFGHPAPATIDAWSGVGAEVLRTDRCGAIAIADGSAATMLGCGPVEEPYRDDRNASVSRAMTVQ